MADLTKTPGELAYDKYWSGYGKALTWESTTSANRVRWEQIAGVVSDQATAPLLTRIAELEAELASLCICSEFEGRRMVDARCPIHAKRPKPFPHGTGS